jgi:hypothetical protein
MAEGGGAVQRTTDLVDVYALPVEARSDRDDARLAHADLAGMGDLDLLHEHARVVVALALTSRGDGERHWLADRLARVGAERQRRRNKK